jgi:hypothetical protein
MTTTNPYGTNQMNWTISQLDRSLPDGVVLTAHWRVSKTEGAAFGTVYGSISFPAKDPADEDFVPYDQITEAQVIQWVKDQMGDELVAAHEANVQAQIDRQLQPQTASGLPWQTGAAQP